MRTHECRGCNAFDAEDRYCHQHEDYIRNIDDCDEYWNPDDEMERMFGEDGPDDGFDVNAFFGD